MAEHRQQRSRVVWLVGLFLLQLGLARLDGSSASAPSATAHDFHLTRLADGSSPSLRELAGGRPALLVFWTTWCAYCAPELDRGVALAAELAAEATPVELVFINVREPAAVVELDPHVRALQSRVLLDSRGSLASLLGVRGYPAYVLIDSRGTLLWLRHGLDVDVIREVRAALEDAGGG